MHLRIYSQTIFIHLQTTNVYVFTMFIKVHLYEQKKNGAVFLPLRILYYFNEITADSQTGVKVFMSCHRNILSPLVNVKFVEILLYPCSIDNV